MSLTRRAWLVAAVGSGLTMMAIGGGQEKPPAPGDVRIKEVVVHFAKNGIKLQAGERGWWVVTDPKGDGYEVMVHLRTFPVAASEQQMRDALKQINEAYILNAPAHVAMSHPSLRHTDPAKKSPPMDQIPVVVKLKILFKEYRPSPGGTL